MASSVRKSYDWDGKMETPSPRLEKRSEVHSIRKAPSCCDRLFRRIFQVSSQAWEQIHFFYEQLSLDLYLNQQGFFEISAECCQKMNRDGDHRQVLLEWVQKMYQLHGCNRAQAGWAERRKSDEWLNPILLRELEKMAPYYPAAQVLLTAARIEGRPLIELLQY